MSRLSKDPTKTGRERCFACGDPITAGGRWVGAIDVSACRQCAEKTFHLGLDALLDGGYLGNLDPEAFRLYFGELVMRIYWSKRAIAAEQVLRSKRDHRRKVRA